jgi:hypothetical protein
MIRQNQTDHTQRGLLGFPIIKQYTQTLRYVLGTDYFIILGHLNIRASTGRQGHLATDSPSMPQENWKILYQTWMLEEEHTFDHENTANV